MSTSISLTISADQQEAGAIVASATAASAAAALPTKTSKSYCDLRKSTTNIDYCHYQHQHQYHHKHLLHPNATNANLPQKGPGAAALGLPLERRHTGSGSDAADDQTRFLQFDSSKLKRWRQHPRRDSLSDSNDDRDDDHRGAAGAPCEFYQEVDERMSRNSMECPQHQAKYVDKWLDENNNSTSNGHNCRNYNFNASSFRSKSFEEDDLSQLKGNVIGIRGFSSESFIAESKRCQENYNKLKTDYLKLLADYNRLRRKSSAGDDTSEGAALSITRTASRKKDHEMGALKELVIKQGKRLEDMAAGSGKQCTGCDECRRRADQAVPVTTARQLELANSVELDKCQYELRRLELKLDHQKQKHEAIVDKLKCDNDQLREQVGERDSELAKLRLEVKNLSLEPDNRRYLSLYQENVRLKDSNNRDLNEYQLLRVNYDKLEARLKSLCEDHKCMSEEQSDEFKRLMVELCRLQVYQPKLEMILDTERKIKAELQTQIERLTRDNQRLSERAAALEQELGAARMQTNAKESNEIDKFVGELAAWQDKCRRLKEEKASLEATVHSNKIRMAQLDAKLHGEVDAAREACRGELNRALAQVKKCESENSELVILEQLGEQLNEYKTDRDKLRGEVVALHRELELKLAGSRPEDQLALESMSNQVKQCEQESVALRNELRLVQLANNELIGELELAHNKVDHYSRQLGDQKRRFDMQQKAFEELRDRKEKELAKLRADLNFESYHRQVALRGIEKELRSSLRELEAMKCRFASAKRLNGSATGTNLVGRTSSTAAAAANRVVQFDDQQSSGTTATTIPSSSTTAPTLPSDPDQQRQPSPCATILSRPARASGQRQQNQDQKQ